MDATLENEILADMAKLEKTLTDDLSGERARAMVGYFDQVATSSEQLMKQAEHDAERQLAAQLREGFRAAQRIVRDVWETLHSAALPA